MGASSDAYHILRPEETGAENQKAIRMALRKAQIDPAEIDCVNAHGCSSPVADKVETRSLKAIFGTNGSCPPVSAIKSMIGHPLGGVGAMEAAASILTILNGIIPPTINLDTPDPECDLDCVPMEARSAKVKIVLSNSLGFGGHNSALIFRGF